jgi:hypothetical protein
MNELTTCFLFTLLFSPIIIMILKVFFILNNDEEFSYEKTEM